MADKTWDVQDPRELPYRFSFSPITNEVFVIMLGLFDGHIKVSMMFENREAFHRFLVEGNKTDYLIADKGLRESEDILKAKGE